MIVVMDDVMLRSFTGMVRGVQAMSRRGVRMMCARLVVVLFVMLGGLFVMFGSAVVMIACRVFVRHQFFPCVAAAFSGSGLHLTATMRSIRVRIAS